VKTLVRFHNSVLTVLAIFASVMLVGVFLAIIYDVTLRTLRFIPPIWTSAFSEYVLLYATTLAAPWLMREKGHVFITTFIDMLPQKPRQVIAKLVYLIGTITCLIIAYVSFQVLITSQGMEIRTFEIPRWTVFVSMPIAFLLLAVEFARFLVGIDSLYHGVKSDEGV
jgi:TRAP-type C4-dicarboxylate transport system permease small subunit